MKPAPVDFRLLLLTVNVFFILCVLTFLYLLFQDPVDQLLTTFHEPTPVVEPLRTAPFNSQNDRVVDGIHEATGLVYADGFELVKANCTICHSAKLITQNRADREGWAQMIDWMQATQGLWDLGSHEPKILDYLSAHYAPEATGRRANLDVEAIEWYVLRLPQ